jgi:hypothetical protein
MYAVVPFRTTCDSHHLDRNAIEAFVEGVATGAWSASQIATFLHVSRSRAARASA